MNLNLIKALNVTIDSQEYRTKKQRNMVNETRDEINKGHTMRIHQSHMTQLLKKVNCKDKQRDGEGNYGLKDLSNMSANHTVLTFRF